MKVLITGGAGFLGSTIASALLDNGFIPVILDNLVTGLAQYAEGRIFYRGDISDGALIDQIFEEHSDIHAVVHCAGLIVVPESVAQPLRYYRENVSKTVEMIDHLARNGCRRILFSSTAALYSAGPDFVVAEDAALHPASPYAETKWIVERLLADCAAAGDLQAIAVRYFNPIGADPKMRTGLQAGEPSHALGRMITAWQRREPFVITGVDWPTPDGTGIRDYIHVWDLAEAHVAALVRYDEVAAAGTRGYNVLNLGSGRGTSVRELIATFSEVVGEQMRFLEAGRRPGDVVGSYARTDRAQQLLGWVPKLGIHDGIRHALEWRTRRLPGMVGRGRDHQIDSLPTASESLDPLRSVSV